MVTRSPQGPDVVIAGAARCGTSSLAAQLSRHESIDPGKVKESNYFSRHFDRGELWYEGNYAARSDELLRLDSSTSYTSPLYPEALTRLAVASPDVFVVFAVRQPTERALSHYLLRRYYFSIEEAPTFGEALAATSLYIGHSDYSHWLPLLDGIFGPDRLLVVPFELITAQPHEVTAEICRRLQISPPPAAVKQAERHRNAVVEYRHGGIRRLASTFRQSRAYPALRSMIGPGQMRKARGLITRPPSLPTTDESLATCTEQQLDELRALDERSAKATREHLEDQDVRLGLQWGPLSFAAGTA